MKSSFGLRVSVCLNLVKRTVNLWASRVSQQSKALHCSAWGVTTDPGLIPGCMTTGRDWESHRAVHNWPSVVQVRGGCGAQRLLVAGWAPLGWLQSLVEQCFLRHIGATGFWVKQAGVKKRMFQRMHYSTFAFPEPIGELQQWDKIVIGYHEIGKRR